MSHAVIQTKECGKIAARNGLFFVSVLWQGGHQIRYSASADEQKNAAAKRGE
ncbi:hypothetical protein [uncultured Ferrovibrio sp.]|jgi:hypothetical protein|uniref:hypothetical protein n=1 Tax=uncultured Ferrovibrio sp. TaxID=1576913 RepID=UPI0026233AAB|nr:hypothetical protein [uncultured Ferrovibrio sp.]